MAEPSSACFSAARGLVAALLVVWPGAVTRAQAAPLPYEQAVGISDRAAHAVLSRAGRETCLRGKLTRALLILSDSCQAGGIRNGLCSLADEAVVVTPMTLPFMDDTSRRLLQLSADAKPQAASRSTP